MQSGLRVCSLVRAITFLRRGSKAPRPASAGGGRVTGTSAGDKDKDKDASPPRGSSPGYPAAPPSIQGTEDSRGAHARLEIHKTQAVS